MPINPTKIEKVRYPLAGSWLTRLGNAETPYGKDQKWINCYPKIAKNPITDKPTITLYKRQGSMTNNYHPSSSTRIPSHGCIQWTGDTSQSFIPVIFSWTQSGNEVEFWDVKNGAQVGGDITGVSSCLSLTETSNGGVATLVAQFQDSAVLTTIELWYFPKGGAWTQITDADLPTNTLPNPIFIDGYMVVLTTDGKLVNSDHADITSFNSLSFLSVASSPDAGRALVKHHNTAAVFGSQTIEFYQNIGNDVGSPFKRMPEKQINVGIPHPEGISYFPGFTVTSGDVTFFLGREANSGLSGIYKLEKFQCSKISTPFIDDLITFSNLGYPTAILELDGMNHLFTNILVNSSAQMVYCLETGVWWTFHYSDSTALSPEYLFRGINSEFVISEAETKPHSFTNVYQDNATTYTMTAQTDLIDLNTSAIKFWDAVELIGDKQTTSGTVDISWSDDDYITFTTARTVDPTATRMRLTQCGASRRRAFKITDSQPRALRLEALELTYKLGSH